MKSPRDITLSDIQNLQEYQRQLTAMLAYVDSSMRGQLEAELIGVQEKIDRLWSEIKPDTQIRTGHVA